MKRASAADGTRPAKPEVTGSIPVLPAEALPNCDVQFACEVRVSRVLLEAIRGRSGLPLITEVDRFGRTWIKMPCPVLNAEDGFCGTRIEPTPDEQRGGEG